MKTTDNNPEIKDEDVNIGVLIIVFLGLSAIVGLITFIAYLITS